MPLFKGLRIVKNYKLFIYLKPCKQTNDNSCKCMLIGNIRIATFLYPEYKYVCNTNLILSANTRWWTDSFHAWVILFTGKKVNWCKIRPISRETSLSISSTYPWAKISTYWLVVPSMSSDFIFDGLDWCSGTRLSLGLFKYNLLQQTCGINNYT